MNLNFLYDIRRVIWNLIRFKDPRLIETIDYVDYDFRNVNIDVILIYIKKFKYHRTYFMERNLKQDEIK